MSKTVVIKLVDKKDSWGKFTRYANTKDYIVPYFDESIGGQRYTGLSKEDEEYFQSKLGIADLSPLSVYWDEFRVKTSEKPTILYLANPEDELKYKFLINHKRVAESITDPSIGIKDYYIVDDSKEAEVIMRGASEKIKANKIFSGLSTENKKDILRLYPGYTNLGSVSDEIVDSKLYTELEKKPGVFILHAEDKKRDSKVFLKDLVSAEILRKNKSSYYYGDDFIGHDEETAINYIEDPARQSLKIDLMSQLSKLKKK